MSDKYVVRLSFSSAITQTVEASSEPEALQIVEEEIGGWLANVNVHEDNIHDISVRKLSWRDNEDFQSTLYAFGEPNYEIENSPVWILKENGGVILTHSELVAFTVDNDEKIFDVWHDGHFVDFGPKYYQAYFDYISEKELLSQA